MKKIIYLLLFIIVSSIGYAQNGYQDYIFGMNISEIRSKFPNIINSRYSYNGLFYIMQHLYNSELSGEIPNPQAILGDEFEVLVTGNWLSDNDLEFLFYNNKLVGVITFFNRTNVLPDIRSRYGNGSTYGITWPSGVSEEGVLWLNNSQRFIIWEQHRGSFNSTYQTVAYIEANWIRDICRRRMELFRSQQQQLRSRID